MDITAWLEKNLLQYTVEDKLYTIADKKFLLIEPKEMPDGFKIFDDEDFRIKLEQSDYELIDLHNPHYFLFSFGQQWYYTPVDKADTELNLFKYLGKAKLDIKCPEYIMLGCHTGFELCNGSQMPEDWIKKAQFLGMDRLGICELNTLAGALKFQDQCDKAKIKSIIGETITVKKDNELYELKLFVKNEIGWQNLLNINSQLNVFNETFVLEEFVFKHSQGLICVVSSLKKLNNKFIANIKKYFEDCFYQLDFVQYQSNEKDREHLLNLQGYLQTWLDDIQPVLLCDAYYLDQQDYYIKNLLNKVGKIGFKHQSKDQYFKTVDDITMQAGTLGIKPETLDIAIRNSLAISESCNFKIRKDQMHLPKYEMNEEQKKKFETNNDLFFHLIEKGFDERIVGKVEDDQIYYDRFAEEITIIEKGGFIDYFLILWDILNWCKENDILTGPGRGSSASALTSYLLYITHLDPIRYKLIFERFLNEARLKSLPDIDVDFESEYRDKVKQYIQTKYTFDNVCCIGTFNNFKIKSCIKDLSREMNIDYSKANFISSLIDKDFEDGTLIDLFKCSLKEPKLKEFINEYPNLIHAMQLILFQPKVKSIHAAGVIVTPKHTDKSKIYDLLPVRVEDGILISEWDKLDVDATGFLKEDILGLHQLDKINNMLKLIKKNRDITIDINTIDVTDQKVFEYFKKGLTEDVFQFNTDVQKKYMIDLQPETIEELIAANALNRPGPMESNAQIDFIKRKNGQQEVKYDKYLEDVTKDTLGLYCLSGETNIVTKRGYIKLKNIVVGDYVLTEDGTYQKVLKTFYNGIKETVKLTTNFGEELICTPDHKVLTQNGWKQVQHLDKYDLIKAFWINKEKKKKGNEKDWLLGYYLGDGANFAFSTESQEFANKLMKIIKRNFKSLKNIHSVKRKSNCIYVHPSKHKVGQSNSKNEFNQFIKSTGIAGLNSFNKFIPDKYANLSLLAGFIEADGNTKNQTIRIKNEKMARHLFELLQSYRIRCTYKKDKNGVDTIVFNDVNKKINLFIKSLKTSRSILKKYIDKQKARDSIRIPFSLLTEEDINKLQNDNLHSTKYNKSRIKISKTKNYICKDILDRLHIKVNHDLWAKIIKIENYKKQKVYDISVEKNHSYVSNGLVTHNCFQEQCMAAYKIITECTPAESDAFRKLTSKIWEGMQDDDKIIKAKKIFFDAYMKKDVTEDYAQDVWDKLIRFSGYGFNIAHSASYAVLGFYSLWFKVHYPLEFWTVSLQFSKEELISAKLTEIDDAKLVKVIAPDINNSNIGFTCDPDTNKIYWSISSVKFAGEVAVASILEERNKNGKFKSLKDFYQRKQKVNKRVIEYLIIAGCFDEVEKVKTEKDRWSVMVNYYKNILGEEVPEQYMSHEAYKDSFWQSKAKEFCGYGYINYDSIVSSLKLKDKYMAAHAILALESIPDKPIVVAGTIALFQEKSSPKAGKYARITLDDNNITLQLILWNDLYEQYADKLKQGSIIVITNVYVKEPNRFSSVNSIQGSGKSKIFFV